MKELRAQEIEQVGGGLDPDTGAVAIIALGFAGGPFTIGFGLAIGLGILFRDL
ncbi:MAG: hypothetical protein AB7V26_03240 [Lysobacterales bacterium]